MALASDGNTTFDGGQDDRVNSSRIRPNQFRRGINITTTQGSITPRPALIHQQWKVVTPGSKGKLTYEKIFRVGKFQCAAPYRATDGFYIVFVISGVIFRADPINNQVEVLEFEGLNQYERRINWSQAGRFLTLYDYPNQTVIIEGRTVRRANPAKYEVPPANMGVYNQNRLFIANEVHEFLAGDVCGNKATPNAPITFEEVFGPNAAFPGQSFSLGNTNTNNPITAMAFLQSVSGGNFQGLGPLIVATKKSAYAYDVAKDRVDWQNGTLGKITLYNSGIHGPRALAQINSDLFFFSGDAQIRSVLQTQLNQAKWSNSPISSEVKEQLKSTDPGLLDLTVMGTYYNWVLCTVRPFRTEALDTEGRTVFDVAFSGIVAMNLENISGLNDDARPAWDGLWTGVNPMELVEFDNDLYVISKDPGNVNRIYKLDRDRKTDEFEGRPRQIKSRLYTRLYDFGDKMLDKQMISIEYGFQDIEGKFSLHVDRRVNQSKKYCRWGTFEYDAIVETCSLDLKANECGEIVCPELLPLESQSLRQLNLGDPREICCDPVTNETNEIFRRIELRLSIEADAWNLQEIRLVAEINPISNTQSTPCNTLPPARVPVDCADVSDWDFYRIAIVE